MIISRSLFLFISIGLIAGCIAGTSDQHGIETVVISSPFPTQSGNLEPVTETLDTYKDETSPYVLPLDQPKQQPPPSGGDPPRTPVGMAKSDLARRLQVDLAWVEVVEVATREPDEEIVSCLTGDGAYEQLWADLDEVQWITLSVKASLYHYVALVDLVVYCD